MRFAHSEHDEAEHCEEVERVARDAVEGDEGAEFADDDVGGAEECVEDHGVDGRESQAAFFVAEEAGEGFAGPGMTLEAVRPCFGGPGHADAAEDFGEEAFFAGGVDEAAAGEGGSVERAETASADD